MVIILSDSTIKSNITDLNYKKYDITETSTKNFPSSCERLIMKKKDCSSAHDSFQTIFTKNTAAFQQIKKKTKAHLTISFYCKFQFSKIESLFPTNLFDLDKDQFRKNDSSCNMIKMIIENLRSVFVHHNTKTLIILVEDLLPNLILRNMNKDSKSREKLNKYGIEFSERNSINCHYKQIYKLIPMKSQLKRIRKPRSTVFSVRVKPSMSLVLSKMRNLHYEQQEIIYDISSVRHSNYNNRDIRLIKKIPSWALEPRLQYMLHKMKSIDPDILFDSKPEICKLNDIFNTPSVPFSGIMMEF